jgi:hypothetical protein
MQTFRHPTPGKLMCFVNKKQYCWGLMKWVTLKVGLEHLDSEKWK